MLLGLGLTRLALRAPLVPGVLLGPRRYLSCPLSRRVPLVVAPGLVGVRASGSALLLEVEFSERAPVVPVSGPLLVSAQGAGLVCPFRPPALGSLA